jgi:hypothetical protein
MLYGTAVQAQPGHERQTVVALCWTLYPVATSCPQCAWLRVDKVWVDQATGHAALCSCINYLYCTIQDPSTIRTEL